MYRTVEEVLIALKTDKTTVNNINRAIHRAYSSRNFQRALLFYEAKIRYKAWVEDENFQENLDRPVRQEV